MLETRVFHRSAEVGPLADHDLRGIVLAVLNQVNLAVDQGIHALVLAGVHKEHNFLVADQISAAAHQVLLYEREVQGHLEPATS